MRWLAGMESDIDRELRKNKHYPSGRYDEPFSPTYHHHYDKTIQQIYDFKPGSFEYFRMLELESRGRELLHFFVRPSPLTCVASNDSARIQFALATDFYIDEDAGLGSPANTDPLEVLRLRIKSSSKNKAGVDIADDIIMTSHDVAKICRLHLLIPTNDRTNSSEFGGNNCTNTP